MKPFKPINSVTDMKTLAQTEKEEMMYSNAGLHAIDRIIPLVQSGKLVVKDVDDLLAQSEKLRKYFLSKEK